VSSRYGRLKIDRIKNGLTILRDSECIEGRDKMADDRQRERSRVHFWRLGKTVTSCMDRYGAKGCRD
jgi:hypothetical protein